MPLPNLHVPFSIPTAYRGFVDCTGLVKASEEGIMLEFQSQDGFLGVFRSAVKNKALFWEEIQSLEYRGGWFRAALVLTARSLKSLQDLPGVENARLQLRITRQDRSPARQLATFASLRLCERDLQDMQRDLERSSPAPTPTLPANAR